MAATLIAETELIEVSSLSVLIYGPPGVGKTSLAQTAANPLTLDLDRGAHRSFNRKTLMRFDGWKDIEAAWQEIKNRSSVVVDTIGRALDLLAASIIEESARWGTRTGGLSQQGWGILKNRFAAWNTHLTLAGKDRILIAHEKEERDGDYRTMRPDVQGGSYTELMKTCDLVGYLYRDRDRGGKRVLDFSPSDQHLGKNAAGWDVIEVPELSESTAFLAELLADAKAKIGRTAAASAEMARHVQNWQDWLGHSPSLEAFNKNLHDLAALTNGAKRQVWHLLTAFAEKNDWVFDHQARLFRPKESAA